MAQFSLTVDDSGNYHAAVDGEILESTKMVKIRVSDSLSVPRCVVEYFPAGTAGARTQQLLAKVPWVKAVPVGTEVPDADEDDMEIER